MQKALTRAWSTLAMLLALVLVWAVPARAQATQRIILTDGSYQTVSEWHKQGDRIRYLSSERGEWEELPDALVDWKATNAWNAEQEKAKQAEQDELKQMTQEQIEAHKQAMMNTPEVAPGLKLPAEGGVFLLETSGGKPLLTQANRARLTENDHTGENLLKKSVIPIATQVQTVELQGSASKVRIHSATPEIFIDFEDQAAESFRLVRLERKKGSRVVTTNKVSFKGDQSSTEKSILSRAEKFGGDWWKLIPLEDLKPGEYALVVSRVSDSPDSKDNATAVWDFGVD